MDIPILHVLPHTTKKHLQFGRAPPQPAREQREAEPRQTARNILVAPRASRE